MRKARPKTFKNLIDVLVVVLLTKTTSTLPTLERKNSMNNMVNKKDKFSTPIKQPFRRTRFKTNRVIQKKVSAELIIGFLLDFIAVLFKHGALTMTESVIFDISDACFIRLNQFCFIFNIFKKSCFLKFPLNTANMVKNLQCLNTLQICYLRHAERHAKNRTSLRGLDHDTLFLNDPLQLMT